jgi:hypothetical protein
LCLERLWRRRNSHFWCPGGWMGWTRIKVSEQVWSSLVKYISMWFYHHIIWLLVDRRRGITIYHIIHGWDFIGKSVYR